MISRDSNSASVTISSNGGDAVHRMTEGAQDFAIARSLDVGDAARLSIIVEELVFNLVEHGGIGPDGEIMLVLTRAVDTLEISLTDTGPAFDPRAGPSQEEIPERGGGVGIDLVRAWAEITDYCSEAGRNRLELRMKLT